MGKKQNKDYYLGIDLGGTNIVAGVIDGEYNIIGRATVKTGSPRTGSEVADNMVIAAYTALSSCGMVIDEIKWAGIGSPGAVDAKNGVVEYANNLPFNDTPLRELIKERLKSKDVYIDNDANAACYGEVLAGNAVGCENVVAITLGTGVGGGVLIGGRILSGADCAAGELGHIGMIYEGRTCSCGRKGCVEAYCSATGLINLTREYMDAVPDSKMWELYSRRNNTIDAKICFEAMRAGDTAAKKVVEQYLDYLGYAITNYINLFGPEVLLLGGGLANEGEAILGPLRKYVTRNAYSKKAEKNTRISSMLLGNDAGITGAAFLGRLQNK